MKFSKLVAAALALSLSAAPALAAAPAAAAPQVEPAAENVEGSALYRTGILVPLVGVAVLALAIYLIFGGGGGDDEPVSP